MTLLFISLYLYRYFRKLGHFKILNATMRKWYLDSQGKLVSYVLKIETRKSSEQMTFEELCSKLHRLFSACYIGISGEKR